MISKVKMECIRKGVVWSFKKKPTGLDCIRRRAAAAAGGGSGAQAPSSGAWVHYVNEGQDAFQHDK